MLAAAREPWLVIDPKPMTGDPGCDLCPWLMQVDDPFAHPDPAAVLRTQVELLSEATSLPTDHSGDRIRGRR